ncbi:hypothetical protein OO010_10745 [Flavobacteriaceae bacterium KMM 6898]|nr:hypothetical protein [Flavobacteriaceae bacterium KMM 6898]
MTHTNHKLGVNTQEEEWQYASYGSKACGSANGYIAYSITIDNTDLFERLEEHKIAEKVFNKKWGRFSIGTYPFLTSPIENQFYILIYNPNKNQ